ncbi:hypothetical protein GCM10010840_06180 [Deinococcus aerolatus]|uniref:Aminoglycoside phosphotransferase domain-containing protein n=1 Tax=Deinococcus aerolatus TaxID=522487 RepID=A0ABQ2G1Z7_9DEIO|nr:hypothetical protein GCM10010840_06180 [Deinococcus aerolatus]
MADEGGQLAAQPPVLSAPDLASPLRALGPGLWQVAEKPLALCHTDLHAGQFRWRGGRLTAPLDFRDVAVGPPAWDMASKACFRGWWAAGQVAGDADRDAALACCWHFTVQAALQDRVAHNAWQRLWPSRGAA